MRRLIIVLIALGAFNAYAALGFLARSTWALNHDGLIWLLTVFAMLVELAGPLGDRIFFPALRDRFKNRHFKLICFSLIDWASYLSLGLLSCLFIYFVVADVITFAWKIITVPTSTLTFDHRILLAVIAGAFGTIIIGIKQAAAGPVLRRINIALKNLPKNFDGFTIAQISDLHIGPLIGHDYAANVVNMANGLNPDMIVLTGDFIDGTVEDLRDEIAPLTELRAPYGKFFITGNHEYYWGSDTWISEFKRMGMRVLLNEHEIIRRENDAFILAGITDYSQRDSDPKKSIEGAPAGLVKILLAHQPPSYKAAHEVGFDLQLSGHTHGGQYFPFNFVVKLFQRYVKGLYRLDDMQIYVSTGTGYWGPPLRTGIPSELTLITLKTA